MATATNPLTAKPWTVSTLLAALVRANDIANAEAESHDLCSTWEYIMSRIVTETGLPLKGRPQPRYATLRVEVAFVEQDEFTEANLRFHLMELVNEHSSIITSIVVTEMNSETVVPA